MPDGLDAATPLDPAALDDVARAGHGGAWPPSWSAWPGWLLDTTVAYAKERVQFDVPIGSFQAVQHKLVDMALDLRARRPRPSSYAAMCVDADDPDRHRAVHVAKAAAGAAARRAAKDGMQVHGGIGYTWEHDLHLQLRRAYADEPCSAPAPGTTTGSPTCCSPDVPGPVTSMP